MIQGLWLLTLDLVSPMQTNSLNMSSLYHITFNCFNDLLSYYKFPSVGWQLLLVRSAV